MHALGIGIEDGGMALAATPRAGDLVLDPPLDGMGTVAVHADRGLEVALAQLAVMNALKASGVLVEMAAPACV